MSLQELGMTGVGIRVYTALLDAPTCSCDELAARAEVDLLQLATELDALVVLGVVRPDPSAPAGVQVPHPSLTVSSLIEQVEDELLLRYRRVSILRSQVSELETKFQSGQGARELESSGIERVEGIEAIRERIDELTFFCRSSVLSIQPGGPQSREALEASRPLDMRMSRRKVDIRLIHEASVLDDELNRVHLHELTMLHAAIRITDQRIERMLILDGKVAVVPVEPGNSRRGALIVRQPALIVGLIELFEQTWSRSTELPWTAGGSVAGGKNEDAPATDQVGPADRAILLMLASGCTDETIARHLELSVRHLRRSISKLTAELGAKSRFEAGVQAQRRGWLSSP